MTDQKAESVREVRRLHLNCSDFCFFHRKMCSRLCEFYFEKYFEDGVLQKIFFCLDLNLKGSKQKMRTQRFSLVFEKKINARVSQKVMGRNWKCDCHVSQIVLHCLTILFNCKILTVTNVCERRSKSCLISSTPSMPLITWAATLIQHWYFCILAILKIKCT